jgi:hypothetical protein
MNLLKAGVVLKMRCRGWGTIRKPSLRVMWAPKRITTYVYDFIIPTFDNVVP